MNIKYKNKIVAFIDVLGFSEIVYSKTTQRINAYFDIILNNFLDATTKNHLKFIIISDSIVISAPNDKSNFNLMVRVLSMLQAKLLSKGILIRGAISFGDLYLNKSTNIIVGPGLINAYKLESVATYPRIILDRRFITQYYDGTPSTISNSIFSNRELLSFQPPASYTADFVYINYFICLGLSNPVREFKDTILLFKENYYKNEYITKYEWLKVHLLVHSTDRLNIFMQAFSTPKTRLKIRALTNFISELKKL